MEDPITEQEQVELLLAGTKTIHGLIARANADAQTIAELRQEIVDLKHSILINALEES